MDFITDICLHGKSTDNKCGKLRATNFLRQNKRHPNGVSFILRRNRAFSSRRLPQGSRRRSAALWQMKRGGQRLPQHEKYRAAMRRRIFRCCKGVKSLFFAARRAAHFFLLPTLLPTNIGAFHSIGEPSSD